MTDMLPQADLDMITNGRCPVCQWPGFRIGPQGGIAINIECARFGCHARFNAVMFGGQCQMAHRIPNEAEGGARWPTAPAAAGQGSGHRGNFS